MELNFFIIGAHSLPIVKSQFGKLSENGLQRLIFQHTLMQA